MLKDRALRIAWRAWLADKGIMQMLERPPRAEVAERARKYFRWRLEEALEALPGNSSALAEALEEIFLIATGEEEIQDWHPPAIEAMLSKLTEPL
jgi:hypothetical protein